MIVPGVLNCLPEQVYRKNLKTNKILIKPSFLQERMGNNRLVRFDDQLQLMFMTRSTT